MKCPTDDVLGILFSNLQRVVDLVANPAAPHAARQQFYNLNPLPFANWNQPARVGNSRRQDGQPPQDPGFPVLLNPQDYWPAGYNIEMFEHDVHQVKNFISFVARKEIKMLITFKNSEPIEHFVRHMNNLFDVFNSRNMKQFDYKQPLYSRDKDFIFSFLNSMNTYIREFKIKLATNRKIDKEGKK